MDNSLKSAITAMENGAKPIVQLRPAEFSLNIITDAQWRAIHEAAAILSFAGFNTVVTEWISVSPEAIKLIKAL